MSRKREDFTEAGWIRFTRSDGLLDWVNAVLPQARRLSSDPKLKSEWLRHGGTWFAGVNVLQNAPDGSTPDGPALPGCLISQIAAFGLPTQLDRGQISVTYPGYPRQDADESDAAHRYRRIRDAAHIDGLLPIGPNRRRFLREPHAYVLGIPLTRCVAGTSPMVIWEGSHHVVNREFVAQLGQAEAIDWEKTDLTDIYQTTRQIIFEQCERIEVIAQPGEAYMLHRLALHGVAPWKDGVTCSPDGRMIAYFRPDLPDITDWLFLD